MADEGEPGLEPVNGAQEEGCDEERGFACTTELGGGREAEGTELRPGAGCRSGAGAVLGFG